MVKTTCEEALLHLARGEFEDWIGLPPECGPADLAKVFSGGGAALNGSLSGYPTRFRVYQTPEQSEVIHAWFDSNDRVLLITIVAPTIKGDVKALLQHLGTPEKKLPPSVGYHADAHQWIYAKRGLTLYVREHLDEIARVGVYPPTSVEHYEERLGAKDEKRYLPWDQE